ncbi:MAG: hypothetical protein P8171_01220 [Candidatus Thiodiazotropha sp.]
MKGLLFILSLACFAEMAFAHDGAEEYCRDWFGTTGANPYSLTCMPVCTSGNVGMGTYTCPNECEHFCICDSLKPYNPNREKFPYFSSLSQGEMDYLKQVRGYFVNGFMEGMWTKVPNSGYMPFPILSNASTLQDIVSGSDTQSLNGALDLWESTALLLVPASVRQELRNAAIQLANGFPDSGDTPGIEDPCAIKPLRHYGDSDNNTIDGDSGPDEMYGDAGDDNLYGFAGDDSLSGGPGNDTLDAGAGNNNYSSGGDGSDSYLYGAGDGNLTIYNWDDGSDTGDKLVFSDNITSQDVITKRRLWDLVFDIGDNSIIVENYFWSGQGDNSLSVIFSDNTTWNNAYLQSLANSITDSDDHLFGSSQADQISAQNGDDYLFGLDGNDLLFGGAGNDYIHGGNGDDTLDAGPGNDYVVGGLGSDTYIYGSDDGDLIINDTAYQDNGTDRLIFASDIHPDDLTLSRQEDHLLMVNESTGSRIFVLWYFYGNGTEASLNEIVFSDQTIWTFSQIDSITPRDNGTLINGTEGDDVINGGDLSERIFGLEGNDKLYGGAGNDTLNGGPGDNYLQGDSGNDVYIYSANDGDTQIYNWDTDTDRFDILKFSSGIQPSDIKVSKMGSDLVLTYLPTNNQITVLWFFYDSGQGGALDEIRFSDDTVWSYQTVYQQTLNGGAGDDTLNGDDTANNISGNEGDDFIYGKGGDDILRGNSGTDYLQGDTGNDTYLYGLGDEYLTIYNWDTAENRVDILQFLEGIDPNSVSVSKSGDDLILTVTPGEYTITIQWYFYDGGNGGSLNYIEFYNSTRWEYSDVFAATLLGTPANDTIRGNAENNIISGGSGDDYLYGNEGNDTLSGDEGNDYLEGGVGDDTYLFALGDDQATIYNWDTAADRFDRLQFLDGIDPQNITVIRDGYQLRLEISTSDVVVVDWYFYDNGTGGSLDSIEFADDTVWTYSDVLNKVAQ